MDRVENTTNARADELENYTINLKNAAILAEGEVASAFHALDIVERALCDASGVVTKVSKRIGNLRKAAALAKEAVQGTGSRELSIIAMNTCSAAEIAGNHARDDDSGTVLENCYHKMMMLGKLHELKAAMLNVCAAVNCHVDAVEKYKAQQAALSDVPPDAACFWCKHGGYIERWKNVWICTDEAKCWEQARQNLTCIHCTDDTNLERSQSDNSLVCCDEVGCAERWKARREIWKA
jgi:hypothetical protein